MKEALKILMATLVITVAVFAMVIKDLQNRVNDLKHASLLLFIKLTTLALKWLARLLIRKS